MHLCEHCLEGIVETVGVLAAGLGETGLTAAAALDAFGCLAYGFAGIHAFGHKVVGESHGEQRLVGCVARSGDEGRGLGGQGGFHRVDQRVECGGLQV